jgi:hypothetical protein
MVFWVERAAFSMFLHRLINLPSRHGVTEESGSREDRREACNNAETFPITWLPFTLEDILIRQISNHARRW